MFQKYVWEINPKVCPVQFTPEAGELSQAGLQGLGTPGHLAPKPALLNMQQENWELSTLG